MGTWDDLYAEGERQGFAKGGQVKDTGNQPAKKGTSQQEIEAGGTPKLRPGYKKGGRSAKKGAEKMAEKGKSELKKVLTGTKKKAGRKKGYPVHKRKGGRSC